MSIFFFLFVIGQFDPLTLHQTQTITLTQNPLQLNQSIKPTKKPKYPIAQLHPNLKPNPKSYHKP
ncbi:hypothetical protein V6Z11_A05G285800 [Gossypium hirsutum]